MNDSGAKVTKSAKGVNTALSGVGRSAGMAGIQVQQFVGQIQGGQSAMVALSQQGADLGFVLGAPLLGAVVGITASIVGMAWALRDTTEATEDFKFSVDDAIKKLDDLTKSQVVVAIAGTEKTMKSLSKEAGVTGNAIAAINQKLDAGVKVTTTFSKTGAALISSVKLTKEEIEGLTAELAQEQANLDTINGKYNETSQLLVKLTENKKGYKKETIDLRDTAKSVEESLLSQIVALTSGEEAAFRYGIAQQLSLKVGEQIPANIEAQIQAIYKLRDIQIAEAERKKADSELYDVAKGQTEADPALANSQLLHEQRLRDEQAFQEAIAEIKFTGAETVDELYFKELAVHKAMLDSKLASEEDFAKAQLKLATQYSKSKVDEKKLDDKSLLFKEENARQAMSLASFVFEDSKAVSAGIAFINTAEGVTAALAKQNYPGAALTALTGAAQISNILGASKGGGAPASIQAPAAPKEPDFVQDTASLDFTDSNAGGSGTNEIRFATDSGDELVDAIANALNKGQREGHYS